MKYSIKVRRAKFTLPVVILFMINLNNIIEPKMIDLMKIVTPKILDKWKDIAYALYYDPGTVDAIKVKERDNPRDCCRELFKNWLTTNNGAKAGPKVWSTLLAVLKKSDEIADDSVEDMIRKVKEIN